MGVKWGGGKRHKGANFSWVLLSWYGSRVPSNIQSRHVCMLACTGVWNSREDQTSRQWKHEKEGHGNHSFQIKANHLTVSLLGQDIGKVLIQTVLEVKYKSIKRILSALIVIAIGDGSPVNISHTTYKEG